MTINTIIVTRPSPEGEELTTLLQHAHLPAKHLPLFNIQAGTDLPCLQSTLDQLSATDIVIIVSPQVSHVLQSYRPVITFPRHLHYFAVGKKSATLFTQLTGLPVDYPSQENSEGLLALLQKVDTIKNKKILILRGESGRELLSSAFTQLQYLHCYTRQPIHYNANILTENKLTDNDITQLMIVITSIEHLSQLEIICSSIHKKQAKLLVTSERILAKAKQLGWQHIYLASSANNEILVKTITTLCHNAGR